MTKTANSSEITTEWPIYFKDRLILGNLDSTVGVATLWMPKENVASELDTNSFAVCGQLYTKRGLNPMLRNILANPKIRHLILCGVDRQGSGEALIKFFDKGLEKPTEEGGELKGYKIIDDDEALLDKEVPIEAYELIRKNVKLVDLRLKPTSEVAKAAMQFASSGKKPMPFADPLLFPESKKVTPTRLPSDMSVFKIRRDYISDAWIDVLKTINKFGVEIPGMYGKVKEVHNIAVVIEKEDTHNPKIPKFMKFSQNGLDKYMDGFFNKNENREEPYTYGERIFDWDGIDQIKVMTGKLQKFPYDRGAIADLWKPHKDNFPPKGTKTEDLKQTKGWKVPCLVMLLGQCLENEFNMTVVFRVNDMFGAWPLNCFALRKLQQQIAKDIGKNLGSLTTISHIAEIYEIDFDDAAKVVKENDSLDSTCRNDPRSYYTVEVDEEGFINLRFFSPDGAVMLIEYREDGKKPKVARDMCVTVIKDMLIEEMGAAMDLGRQLAKAENAVKLGLVFEQDNLLKFKK